MNVNSKTFSVSFKEFSLSIIIDEPHLYLRILGINMSPFIHDLRKLTEEITEIKFNTKHILFILTASMLFLLISYHNFQF